MMKNQKMTREQSRFIHDFSRLLARWNIPIMVARVYCYLQIMEYPSSLEEIAEAMSTTKGNISTAATLLEAQGSATRITKTGSRRVLYTSSDQPGMPFTKHVDLLIKMANLIEKNTKVSSSDIVQERLNALSRFDARLGNLMADMIKHAHHGD